MKATIKIPKDFENHFLMDRFEGIMNTLTENFSEDSYEKNFSEMLINAFKNAKIELNR